jgi:hypothetical protein
VDIGNGAGKGQAGLPNSFEARRRVRVASYEL